MNKRPRRAHTALLLGTLLLAGAGPARATDDDLPSQRFGLELAPTWLHLYGDPRQPGASELSRKKTGSPVAVGIGATLRLFRVGMRRTYWTPIQLGVGAGAPSRSNFAHLSTELGARPAAFGGRLELGAAVGLGLVLVDYSEGCDGGCGVGGGPVVFAPVIRYELQRGSRYPIALFTRWVVPLSRPTDPRDHVVGHATLLMFGLDIGRNS